MRDITQEALERFKNVPEQMAWSRRHRIAASIKLAAVSLRRKGIELPSDKTSYESHIQEAHQYVKAVNSHTLDPQVVQLGTDRRLYDARQQLDTVDYPLYHMGPETVQDRNQDEGMGYAQKAA